MLYLLSTKLGAGGVVAARWLISTAVVASWRFGTSARHASATVVAFCAGPAALLAAVAFTTIRAGLYTMLFLAVMLAAIDADRERPRPARFLLIWLPVAVLWINLHGGWIIGADRRRAARRGAGAAAAAVVRTSRRGWPPFRCSMALTPYGRDYFVGWWRSITFPRHMIAEWAPLVIAPTCWGWRRSGWRSCC